MHEIRLARYTRHFEETIFKIFLGGINTWKRNPKMASHSEIKDTDLTPPSLRPFNIVFMINEVIHKPKKHVIWFSPLSIVNVNMHV